MQGQIDFDTYIASYKKNYPSCSNCVCRNCLLWNSGRCPHGECHDDLRASQNPYDKAHPNKQPRKLWSNWNKPGEQAHWCRGGTFYPIKYCDSFIKYTGCRIEECIKANVAVYQDGYISCSLVESIGCESCYKDFVNIQEE